VTRDKDDRDDEQCLLHDLPLEGIAVIVRDIYWAEEAPAMHTLPR